jgi:excisionase family DNA binding protein
LTDHLLTARALAEQLDVSAETVLRWARRGEIPSIHLPGGAVRFRERDIARWLEERAAPSRGVSNHPGERRPAARLSGVEPPPKSRRN